MKTTLILAGLALSTSLGLSAAAQAAGYIPGRPDPTEPGVSSYTEREYCLTDLGYRQRHIDRCAQYFDEDRASSYSRSNYRKHRHHRDDLDNDRDNYDRDYDRGDYDRDNYDRDYDRDREQNKDKSE